MKINFTIDHIDTMGQGVSKEGTKITFIPKTLPTEMGLATIFKESKGVIFASIASVNDISKLSDKRIEAACPHFQSCPGCHFLHTTYDNELEFKILALKRHLSQISKETNWQINVYRSKTRHHYRNRIQLHYDKQKKKLGLINPILKSIIKVPHCIVATEKVTEKLKELYQNDSWINLVTKEKRNGHIEIYERKNGEIKISINKPYSDGEFTQVNKDGNAQLIETLNAKAREIKNLKTIIDLFGGKGNLSKEITDTRTYVTDITNYSQNEFAPHQTYIKSNLFDEDAPQRLHQYVKESIELIIVDPPRSGIKNLNDYCSIFNPENIFYVSCNPATLCRDIKSIHDKFQIKDISIFDFFPGSYHFETLITLEKKI